MSEREEHIEDSHPSLRLTVGLMLLSMIAVSLAGFLTPSTLGKSRLLIGELLFILPAILYIMQKNYRFRHVFRLHMVEKRLLLPSLALAISIPVLTDELDKLLGNIIKMPPEIETFMRELLTANSAAEWLILFTAAVLVAGVAEEMLFRGLLQKALERRFDVNRAILLSAFFFALFHMSPWWLAQILILGVLLGFLAWRSDSIIPGVLLHCFNNAFALLMINLNPEGQGWYNWHDHVNPTVLVISAGLAYYGLKWFYQFTKSPETNNLA